MLKKRILVAEDDEDDQHFLREFLQNRDDILLMPIADNGVVLMEQLEQSTDTEMPHCIIIDQNMPKRNGLQTLQLLKQTKRYAHIPVIIYSTYTDDSLIKKGAAMGACLVVAKPITKDGYDKMMNGIFAACM
jgi:CheY-like chemotaxis protein